MSDLLNLTNAAQSTNGEPDLPCGGPVSLLTSLIDRLRAGEPAALLDLHALLSKGVRFSLCRELGPEDLDDQTRDVLLNITRAIQSGDLREPDQLLRYTCNAIHFQVAAHVDGALKARRQRTSLESETAFGRTFSVAVRVIKDSSKRDREILMRSYLRGQTPDEIASEMALTDTRIRLVKSRAKARFIELGQTSRSRGRRLPTPLSIAKACGNYATAGAAPDDPARVNEHLLVCQTCRQHLADNDIFVAAMQLVSKFLSMESQRKEPTISQQASPTATPTPQSRVS